MILLSLKCGNGLLKGLDGCLSLSLSLLKILNSGLVRRYLFLYISQLGLQIIDAIVGLVDIL